MFYICINISQVVDALVVDVFHYYFRILGGADPLVDLSSRRYDVVKFSLMNRFNALQVRFSTLHTRLLCEFAFLKHIHSANCLLTAREK